MKSGRALTRLTSPVVLAVVVTFAVLGASAAVGLMVWDPWDGGSGVALPSTTATPPAFAARAEPTPTAMPATLLPAASPMREVTGTATPPPSRTSMATPQAAVVPQVDPPSQPGLAPVQPPPAPAPTPAPTPSIVSVWYACESTWTQGETLEFSRDFPEEEPFNASEQQLWDRLVSYDQANCQGIGAALVQEVGDYWCFAMLEAAAFLRNHEQFMRDLGYDTQNWHFFWRRLAETDGYILNAGC